MHLRNETFLSKPYVPSLIWGDEFLSNGNTHQKRKKKSFSNGNTSELLALSKAIIFAWEEKTIFFYQ